MSNHTLSWLFTALGALLLCALVWWLGPSWQLGSTYPLESVKMRLVCMAVLCTLLALPLLVRHWRRKRAQRGLHKALTESEERAQAQAAHMDALFAQALDTLKTHRPAVHWTKRWWRNQHWVYDLPWYAIIGPSGSGKSTALQHAGLRFPLQAQTVGTPIQGIGGTRHCDWWFAEQAVWIDTAGRFTTQDADPEADQAGWQAFLRQLAHNRPRQALNGVLLTFSKDDLQQPAALVQALTATVRLRLQEVIRALGQCPPVYLLITKMDRVPGFQATFDLLPKRMARQAWGINFSDDLSLAHTLEKTLPEEMCALLTQLKTQMLGRLEAEPSETRRIDIFAFHDNLVQITRDLEAVIQQVFAGDSVFESPVRLRGVYLSSSLQEGSGLDRLAVHMGDWAGAVQRSRAYFVEGLVQDVMLAEQHLVGWSKQARRMARWQLVGSASAAAALVLGLSTWWAHSLGLNQNLLETTEQRSLALATALHAQAKTPDALGQPKPETLQSLYDLQALPDMDGQTHPFNWRYRGGLNQSDGLLQVSQQTHRKGLQTSLLPHVQHRLEQQLKTHTDQASPQLYEVLRAYLMIYTPHRYQANMVWQAIEPDWRTQALAKWPTELQTRALAQLEQTLALGPPTGLPPLNARLVEQARAVLTQAEPAQRILNDLERKAQALLSPNWDVLRVVGPELGSLLTRKSNVPVQTGPASLYTRTGYSQVFAPQLGVAIEAFMQEARWVLDQQLTDQKGLEPAVVGLTRRVRELYTTQYIAQWEGYLRDIRIRPPADLTGAVELSRLVASPGSPLKRFLRAVARETQLGGHADVLAKKLKTEFIEQRIDQHFLELGRLFDQSEAGYQPVQGLLNELYTQLSTIESAKRGQALPPDPGALLSLANRAGLMPEPVRSLANQLAMQAGAHGDQARKSNLSAGLGPLFDTCNAMVSERYPFQAQSTLDALPADFARLFSPSGLLQQTFQQTLAGQVDMSTPRWRLKTSAGPTDLGNQNSEALAQFQRAARIQEAFFTQGSKPQFQVDIRLVGSSNPQDTLYLDYHGKLLMFSMQFDPRHTVTWPPESAQTELKVRSSDDSQALTLPGPWALFRLFDRASVRPGRGSEQFVASLHLQQKHFELEVTSQSAFNPLRLSELRQFRCPRSM